MSIGVNVLITLESFSKIINKFKEVNDTYGHRTGDDVLKTFADILLQFFPRESVFRYGGDEFILITKQSGAAVDAVIASISKEIDKINICKKLSALWLAGKAPEPLR